MKDESLKRLAGLMALNRMTGQAVGQIIKEKADAALAAEKKRVEDSKRIPAVAMIDGKVIGECYIDALPGKGPVEVGVTPLSAGWSERITGQINGTSPQKEAMKRWKKKYGLR
jgi:hypothetical protein